MFHFSLSRISSLAPSFLRLLLGWGYSSTVWDGIFTSCWCSSWVVRLWCQRTIGFPLVASFGFSAIVLLVGNLSASASEIRCLSMVSFCTVWRFLIRHLLVIYFVLLFCMTQSTLHGVLNPFSWFRDLRFLFLLFPQRNYSSLASVSLDVLPCTWLRHSKALLLVFLFLVGI